MNRPRVAVLWHAGMLPGYLAMFRALAEDCRLHLILPQAWKVAGKQYQSPASLPGMRVHRLNPRFAFRESTLWYPGLGDLLRQIKPQLLHIKAEPTSVVYLQAAAAMRELGGKLVFETLQNLPVLPKLHWNWIQRRTFEASDAAVAVTGEIKKVLRGFGYQKPVAVLPLWVDTTLFKAGSGKALRKRLALGGHPVVGYVGRLAEEKGLDVLIAAMARLPGHWRGLWVGSGPDQARLQRLLIDHRLVDRVHLLAATDQRGLVAAYRAMDVLALPSRSKPWWKEQFGRVLVEAMACGVACVGSDSGAIAEVMGKAGIAVPEGDPRALASALKKSVAQKARRKRAALARARQYSARAVAKAHAVFYRTLIKK